MATAKPIIKLPPRHKLCSTRTTLQEQFIYFEDKENKLDDCNILNLLKDYSLYQINRERGGGYLSFRDAKMADRAYSLFNGYTFSNGVSLKLRLSFANDPQPEGYILEVRHLPTHLDHNALYEIFRPFGPLNICKPITEEGVHRGKALVQFFYKEHSDNAVHNLNNKDNSIQITPLIMSHSGYMTQSPNDEATTIVAETTATSVDYTNLYVKNLDATVENSDLFNIFRKYGRIVSARVMTHNQNGLSKGYGFVSFGKQEEAALALQELNEYEFRGKPMVVAYHEPKKPRQEKSTSTTTSSFHSPTPTAPIDYATTPYFETRHPHEVGLGIDHLSMNNIKDLSVGTTLQRNLSMDIDSFSPPSIRQSPQFVSRPSLASLASGVTIQVAPTTMYDHEKTAAQEKSHTLRRRESLESVNSVMTESSAQIQRQRMTAAVKRCGNYGNNLSDIVDMLLTLKKKERSICLFNTDFLREKINAAVEALEVCDDDEDDNDDDDDDDLHRQMTVAEKRGAEMKYRTCVPSPPKSPLKKKKSVNSLCIVNNFVADNVVIPCHNSKAIPIIAPPPPLSETPKAAEIKALSSIFEKKQLLGDQLFPLVKSTGIKHAPKITILLLDTIPLETLANIMFDAEALKVQVDKAFANL